MASATTIPLNALPGRALPAPALPDRRGGGGRRDRDAAPPSIIHRLALALVWLAIASGAIVFAEPAPVDLVMAGLIVLLPVIGLARFRPALLYYFALWLIIVAASLFAATQSTALTKPVVHAIVTLFLALGMLVISAFVARRPARHMRLIMNAQLAAATLAAMAGIIGYFNLLPGTHELFTKFDRATGPFKDPNVFGPFLAIAALYALHLILSRPLRSAVVPMGMFAFLVLGLLLSFSRGAWINFALSVFIFAYLSYLTARSEQARFKLIGLSLAAIVAAGLAISVVLQIDQISDLLEQRASLTQSYDVGPDGRFGGQQKAGDLILHNPLGIGATEFQTTYHHEDVHNVYLVMFLNAGWLGGWLYLFAVLVPVFLGMAHAFRRVDTQAVFLVVYACYVANVAEGIIIDTDHWRHFYLLLAMVMGLWAAQNRLAINATSVPVTRRTAAPQPLSTIVPQHQPRRSRQARLVRPIRALAVASPVARNNARRFPPRSAGIYYDEPGYVWIVSEWRLVTR